MTLDEVKQLVANGTFHHATARTIGRAMLWIYVTNSSGPRGFGLAGAIDDTAEAHAYFRSIGHGVSVGAYGSG